MAISAGVGPAESTPGTSTTAAVTLNGCTAGRSLVCLCEWGSTTATISSITVSGESNMTVHATTLATNSTMAQRTQIASLANITSGGNKTITMTLSASVGCHIWVMEYAGGDTTSWFDAGNAANGNTANPSLTLTTVANNCHIISIIATQSSTTPTAGTNYTGFAVQDSDWFDHGEQDTDFDAGVAGAKTVNYTLTATDWAMSAASFKPSAGGGGGGSVTWLPVVQTVQGKSWIAIDSGFNPSIK